jgi:hypothetical protein
MPARKTARPTEDVGSQSMVNAGPRHRKACLQPLGCFEIGKAIEADVSLMAKARNERDVAIFGERKGAERGSQVYMQNELS